MHHIISTTLETEGITLLYLWLAFMQGKIVSYVYSQSDICYLEDKKAILLLLTGRIRNLSVNFMFKKLFVMSGDVLITSKHQGLPTMIQTKILPLKMASCGNNVCSCTKEECVYLW